MPAAAAERSSRARLADARLLLIFTPDMAKEDPMAALAQAVRHVDIVQVRPKPLGDKSPGAAAQATVTEARTALEWTRRVLALACALPREERPLIFVNDRVDVAIALASEGVDGVHIGTDDMPPRAARERLGPELLLGLSSHTSSDLTRAWDEPIDMLGFGPVFATATKGYGLDQGSAAQPAVVGPERAWIAAESSPVPLFPIGGIGLANVDQLDRVGRAAVGSAILGAADPALAAASLRAALA